MIAGFLNEFGIDSSSILLENGSRNTHENAINSGAVLQENQITSALLVTSALHMPRAAAVFRRAGVDFTPVSIDTLSSSLATGSLFAYLPTSRALDISTRAIKEWIGLLVYRLRGWA